jgi:hypothetical protein
MRILDEPIACDELRKIAAETFGDLIKAVVDVRQGLVALDAELHSDLEALLIEKGSQQYDLWASISIPTWKGRTLLNSIQ